ncbi:hypothetical protein NFI96_007766 [Prochilodus magdalenae]|nr:hypothetical protein NFI96_007766 [Prochilodus magdalenae]
MTAGRKGGLGLSVAEPEALFDSTFPPCFVKEGDNLVLCCSFSSPLLPSQQDVSWFRDGVPLSPSGRVDVRTTLSSSTLTLNGVHKEHEGLYSVRLHTRDGTKEHSAFVYIKVRFECSSRCKARSDSAANCVESMELNLDENAPNQSQEANRAENGSVKDANDPHGPAAVVGAPGSPLQVECSDVNRDYVFLSWKPPSADGAAQVQGYFIESSEGRERESDAGKKGERVMEKGKGDEEGRE